MKYVDIKQKSDKELVTLLGEQHQQLSQVLIDMRTKQVKNVKQIAKLKTDIARILTEQRARLLAQAVPANEATVTGKEANHG